MLQNTKYWWKGLTFYSQKINIDIIKKKLINFTQTEVNQTI